MLHDVGAVAAGTDKAFVGHLHHAFGSELHGADIHCAGMDVLRRLMCMESDAQLAALVSEQRVMAHADQVLIAMQNGVTLILRPFAGD